uniref:Uncharacterized protein n=1 Tax=Arundo donax TaxID=35708 RepID=A0A0A9G4C9_ARUDO
MSILHLEIMCQIIDIGCKCSPVLSVTDHGFDASLQPLKGRGGDSVEKALLW